MVGVRLAPFVLALTSAASGAGAEPEVPERARMEVADVLVGPDGQNTVLLRSAAKPHRFLAISVGEPEALAIRLRLAGQEPPRPLTLNLLESVLATSNVKVIEIQIHDLRGSVFFGKIRLKQNNRTWDVDARPSDAIGLALGTKAPIWVGRGVLKEAGFSADVGPGEGRPRTLPRTQPPYEESL